MTTRRPSAGSLTRNKKRGPVAFIQKATGPCIKRPAGIDCRDEFFDKALAFAQRVNENTDCVVTVTDLADQQAFAEALASADILTNGTKVGMKPLENESLVNDISLLHPGLLVTECVYNPHMTKLLQQAQQAGCKTIDGYGMLLWQGAEQFTLWTGKDFPLEYVKQVMGFGA